MQPQPRRVADRYELQGPLGQGGMAEVWRARDLRLDRTVAVKILNQRGSTDPVMAERFQREAHAAARITHPNIVATYDFGTDEHRPYLVMELVEGRTLQAMLDEGALPLVDAVRIAAQAGAALEAAHGAGVIHRDIKPSNLIVSPDGTVKVLDFGIARLRDAIQAKLTHTATVVGTSYYMAPEQASGAVADERTDLYALGCLLYAMLAGTPPFTGENPMSVLYQHMHATPQPVRELRPDTPEALAGLVGALLAKDPADRPQSASAVRTQLQALASQPGLTAQLGAVASVPPGDDARTTEVLAGSPAQPPRRRLGGRRAALLAAAALAALALLLIPLLLSDGDRTADPGRQPKNTGATPATSSPATRQSTSASPTPEATATDPASRIAQLRELLDEKDRAGEIDADAARKLREDLQKISEEHREGELADAAENTAELRDRLDELSGEGKISGGAHSELAAAADRLAASLPPPEGDDDEGDDPGQRKGKDKEKHNGKGKGKDKDD